MSTKCSTSKTTMTKDTTSRRLKKEDEQEEERTLLLRVQIEGEGAERGYVDSRGNMIKSALRSNDFDVTVSVNDQGLIKVFGDPNNSRPIPPKTLDYIAGIIAQDGYGARLTVCHGGINAQQMQETIDGLVGELDNRDIQIGRLLKKTRSAEVAKNLAEADLKSEKEEAGKRVQEARDQAQKKVQEAAQRVIEAEAEAQRAKEESAGRLRKIKELNREYEGVDLDEKGINYLLLKRFAKKELPSVWKIINEIESGISEFESQGMSKDEIYRRIEEGRLEIDELPAYRSKRQGYENKYRAAQSLLTKARDEPESAELIDTAKAQAIVDSFEADLEKIEDGLREDHEKSKQVAGKLVRNRRVLYLMESEETDREHIVNVYVPIKYKEDLSGLKPTEIELASFVHKAWIALRDLQSGEGSFESQNVNGVICYQFKLPKVKISDQRMKEIRETFADKIFEEAKNSPLYRLGLRAEVYDGRVYRKL